eukprot:4208239-Prymnesium_polylepis.1
MRSVLSSHEPPLSRTAMSCPNVRDVPGALGAPSMQRSARRVAHATLTRSMVPTDAGNRQCGDPARYEKRSSVWGGLGRAKPSPTRG